jgi:hypothetical protein
MAGSRTQNFFYLSCALILSLVVFAGFARTYYLTFLFDTPRLPSLLEAHGAVMTAWVALFVTQTGLISIRRVDLHRRLGMASSFLAIAIVSLGSIVAIRFARRPFLAGTSSTAALSFLGVQLLDVLLIFAVFFTAGLLFRSRPEYHKRFMLLAFLRLIPPAVQRIVLLFSLQHHAGILPARSPIVPAFDLLAVILIATVDTIRNRRLHPVFLWGGLLLAGSDFAVIFLSRTEIWLGFARWLIS